MLPTKADVLPKARSRTSHSQSRLLRIEGPGSSSSLILYSPTKLIEYNLSLASYRQLGYYYRPAEASG
jgi:hypothetical protein